MQEYWMQAPLSREDLDKLSEDERSRWDEFLAASGDTNNGETDLLYELRDMPLWDTDFFNPGGQIKKPYIVGFGKALSNWFKSIGNFKGTGGLTGTDYLNATSENDAEQIAYITAANTGIAQGGTGLNTHH